MSGEIRLRSRPHGEPTAADFELVEVAEPAPEEGEIVVRNSWLSIDPSTRIRMREAKEGAEYLPRSSWGKPLAGWAVGEVVSSRAPQFAVGDQVLHPFGWRRWAHVDAGLEFPLGAERITDDSATPAKDYLGKLGWVARSSRTGSTSTSTTSAASTSKRRSPRFASTAGAPSLGAAIVYPETVRGHRARPGPTGGRLSRRRASVRGPRGRR